MTKKAYSAQKAQREIQLMPVLLPGTQATRASDAVAGIMESAISCYLSKIELLGQLLLQLTYPFLRFPFLEFKQMKHIGISGKRGMSETVLSGLYRENEARGVSGGQKSNTGRTNARCISAFGFDICKQPDRKQRRNDAGRWEGAAISAVNKGRGS